MQNQPKHTIKVGDVYKTREGGTAEIVATDLNFHGFTIGAIVTTPRGQRLALSYTDSGAFNTSGTPDSNDIILPEPQVFPWADMPKWVNFVAKDDDEDVLGFMLAPMIDRSYRWWSHDTEDDYAAAIPHEYLPQWYLDLPFAESLIERPEEVQS